MWVCSRTPAARASAAQSRISSPVTVNGEQGATAMRVIESGAGSCQRSIAACEAARIVSWSSTTESGGRPPADCPRFIEPRVGWKRTPIRRAARISASSRSPAPAGNTYRWSVLDVQPVRASQARLAAAAALIRSGVSRAQIGYSVSSQPNRVASVA